MPRNIRFESDSQYSSDDEGHERGSSYQHRDIKASIEIVPAFNLHNTSAMPRTRTRTPPPKVAQSTWYDDKAGIHRSRSDPYNPEMCRQIEEDDTTERITHPHKWLQRLEDMQNFVLSNSALSFFLESEHEREKNQRVPIPFPEDTELVPFSSMDVEVANAIRRGGSGRTAQLRPLLDSVAIAVRALVNLQVMRGDRFMGTSISAFVLDRTRNGVASMVTIQYPEIYGIARTLDTLLSYEIKDSTAVTWVKEDLFQKCSLLLEKFWGPGPTTQLSDGSLWLLTARTIDLAVASYSTAHVGNLDLESTEPRKEIELLSGVPGMNRLRCRKRNLACLDAFLNEEQAWVFESGVDQEDAQNPPLYVSATMIEIADIWGPAWQSSEPTLAKRSLDRSQARSYRRLSASYKKPTVEDAGSSDASSRAWNRATLSSFLDPYTPSIPEDFNRGPTEVLMKTLKMMENELMIEEQKLQMERKKRQEEVRGKTAQHKKELQTEITTEIEQRSAHLTKIYGEKAAMLKAKIKEAQRNAVSAIQQDPIAPAQYFHLGHGLILPWAHTAQDPVMRSEETLCHWTSDAENLSRWNDNAKEKAPSPLIATDKLLIGATTPKFAAGKALLPDANCRKEELNVYQTFRRQDILTQHRVVYPTTYVDATTINASLGVHGVGLGGQRSFKRKDGTFMRDEIIATWNRRQNPTDLKARYGLEVSFCTTHARRVTLFHLLCSSTMRNCLEWAGYLWPDDSCKEGFYGALQDESVADFRALQAHSQGWRNAVNNAVSTCLAEIDRLEKADSTWLHAYWVPQGDSMTPCAVRLHKDRYDWAELVADSPITGAFTVISNECLKMDRERESCGICSSAVLETGIVVNTLAKIDERVRNRQDGSEDFHWLPSHFRPGNRLRLKEGEMKVVITLKHRLHVQWKGQIIMERYQRDKGRPRECHWEAVQQDDFAPGFAECVVPLFVTKKGVEISNASVPRGRSPSPPPPRRVTTRFVSPEPIARPIPRAPEPPLRRNSSIRSGTTYTEGTDCSDTVRGTTRDASSQPEMTQVSSTRHSSPDRAPSPTGARPPLKTGPRRPQHTTSPRTPRTPRQPQSTLLNPNTSSDSLSPSPRPSRDNPPVDSRTGLNQPPRDFSPDPEPRGPAQRKRRRRHHHGHHRNHHSGDAKASSAGTYGGYQTWSDGSYGRGRERRNEGGGFWSRLFCIGGGGSSEMR
ncbi:MAG: hypothetical protein M1828_005838 [Chrysothrix sp. TS-e1954]|nr:MAG: hypothetical protein M1828_005838 [Chrysothrix sp. TS-e1954]